MADEFNNDSLLELYLYESSSLLDSLDDILLGAEADGNLTDENVNEIFRIMHTIKGSSAMMAYNGISEVSHKTEDLFAVIRNSGLNMAYFNELFDVVLAVSDFLKTEIGKVQEGHTLEDEVEPLVNVVLALTEKMRDEDGEGASPDLGRTLGEPYTEAQVSSAQETSPQPAPEPLPAATPPPENIPQPKPAQNEVVPPEPAAYMPEAPEGGRILGAEPENTEKDDLAADISKITARTAAEHSAPGGQEIHFLHVHFNEGSKMENIRAFMLINKLAEKGNVNRTIPANPESDPEAATRIAENGFYVSYTTSLLRDQIEALVKGTLSVEAVAFVRRLPDSAEGENEAHEPPKPEPRPQPIMDVPEVQESASASIPPDAGVQAQESTSTSQPGRESPAATGAEPYKHPTEADKPARPVFVDITQQTAKPPVPPAQPPAAPQLAAEQKGQLARPIPANEGKQADTHPSGGAATQNIISVELKKLDTLLDLVGEIVINESIVTENPDLEELELPNFRKAARQLDKLTNELQDTVMSIRMLPVSIVFQRMRRIVRDMSKSLGKDANLILVGEMTEVDKTILDALSDPLMHLVRNAMDHAIETPEERIEAGKAPGGHIILSAQNSGGDVIISVSDDGKGLDRNVIINKARANGLLRKPENEYTDKEIFNLLMAPGFSTKEDVSKYSGRGVGMDVVKSNIEKIGGTVIIESKKGLGTNIILKIPLTLAIISCIEIAIGQDIYSIPINNIRESFKSSAGQLITDPTGSEMIMLRGQPYPIIRLYELFGRSDAVTDVEEGILVLVDAGDRSACLLADSLIGKFQIVVKPLPSYMHRFGVKRSGISGCTIMGNGNISLIINVQEMVE